MRLRYPAGQNAIMDREDADHNIIPGEWRNGLDLPDLRVDDGRNTGTKAAQIQRQYLKEYYNNPVGAVSLQNKMI